jgi:hypothetical protein
MGHDTSYMFERHDQKLTVFAFQGHFHELLPTVLGFRGDLQGPWHSLNVWEVWPKTCHFNVFGPFRELLSTVLGFRGDFQGPWHLVHVWEAWPKTRCLCVCGHFCELLATVLGLWGGFTWPMTLSTCLRGMTKNLSFLHFWAIFVSCSPQFWGSWAIYMANDTQYMFERHDQNSSFLRL